MTMLRAGNPRRLRGPRRAAHLVVLLTLLVAVSLPQLPADAQDNSSTACGGRRATMRGTPGQDRIVGTPNRDVITARNGNDRINGRGGNDVICGGDGRDVLISHEGEDDLIGGRDNDRLMSGGNRDVLYGGDGFDRCNGGGDIGDVALHCEIEIKIP
jgi:Ca2+-binding RTX toxin-like protein